MQKAGFIAVVGRPNVGKSTLTNRLIGEKLSIVTKKPQTTRTRITAILTRGESQMIFLDTPGFLRPKNRLGEYMSETAVRSIGDVDTVIFVVEPSEKGPGKMEEEILSKVREAGVPCVLAINKVDTVNKERLLPVIGAYSEKMAFAAIVPISAMKGDGVEGLLSEVERLLPEGPWLYEEDLFTTETERQVVSEIIREKMLLSLDEEVPHGAAVEVLSMKEEGGRLLRISANIYCEKSSHKGIVIGKNGAMLKKIGSLSREELERFFDTKVYLELWVKVKEDWRNKDRNLSELGFK